MTVAADGVVELVAVAVGPVDGVAGIGAWVSTLSGVLAAGLADEAVAPGAGVVGPVVLGGLGRRGVSEPARTNSDG